jgi:hypothetical protein
MNRWIRLMSVAALSVGVLSATAAAAGTPQAAGAPKAPAPSTPSTPTKFVAPARGTVELGYLKPVTKREKTMVVTTIKVKNLATGSIVGLKVSEFWYDKGGNPVTGSEDRYRKPLLPGEVTTLTLQTPYNAQMNSNSYTFTHANGQIKTKLLPKME